MERAFNLGNKEFGSESLKAVPHYATPLYWVSAADSGERRVNSGTMFVVDVPKDLFAMTVNQPAPQCRTRPNGRAAPARMNLFSPIKLIPTIPIALMQKGGIGGRGGKISLVRGPGTCLGPPPSAIL